VQRRKALEKVVRPIRKGDALVGAKSNRLALSAPDLVKIAPRLEEKGASLRILVVDLGPAHEPGVSYSTF
jgi:DNA invertase Pin-like site-specific DNA recombinase